MNIKECIQEWRKSLLDTTKRSRLIKFTHGRGGLLLDHPDLEKIWTKLSADNSSMLFPWKRNLLNIKATDIETWEETLQNNTQKSSEPLNDGVPTKVDPNLIPVIVQPEKSESFTEVKGDLKAKGYPATIKKVNEACKISAKLLDKHILTEFTDKKLSSQLLRLSRTAAETESEQGVSTLFMAFGFLKWFEKSDTTNEILSPLLLLQVKLERRSIESEWELKIEEDDVVFNHSLAELLTRDFGIQLFVRETVNSSDDKGDAEGFDTNDYFNKVRESIKGKENWEVVSKVGIGTFNFQKLAMWEDLEKNCDAIGNNELCKAVAGDKNTKIEIKGESISASDMDNKLHPSLVNQILPADSSQQEAIEVIKQGDHIIIDGPPGTGKSQTISNAIAELLAAGKTVLFVSEKAAALEVVKKRLDQNKLGDFCLELHSSKTNKKDVLKNLGKSLELQGEKYPDQKDKLNDLYETRKKLNHYATELHLKRQPLNRSAYEIHGLLSKSKGSLPDSRFRPDNIQTFTQTLLQNSEDILTKLPSFETLLANYDKHPWHQSKIETANATVQSDIKFHTERFANLISELINKGVVESLSIQKQILDLNDWLEAIEFAKLVVQVPIVPKDWLSSNPRKKIESIANINLLNEKFKPLLPSLSDIKKDVVDNITSESLDFLSQQFNLQPDLIKNAESLSISQRLTELNRIDAITPSLSDLLKETQSAFIDLSKLLELTKANIILRNFGEFAKLAKFLARRDPVPDGWWDTNIRAEVTNVAGMAIKIKQSISESKSYLLQRLNLETALSPEALQLIQETIDHGDSWWKWLLPKWRNLRSQVSRWYVIAIPSHDDLIKDLKKLEQLQKDQIALLQYESNYKSSILRSPDGFTDWIRTRDELKNQEKVEKVGIPAGLKDKLSVNGSLDRENLFALASKLTDLYEDFSKRWNELANSLVLKEQVRSLDCSPTEVLSQLESCASNIKSGVEACGRFIQLSITEKEIQTQYAREKISCLLKAIKLRDEIILNCKNLDSNTTKDGWHNLDWNNLAKDAIKLDAFLKEIKFPYCDGLINSLSDQNVREVIENALRNIEGANKNGLLESYQFITQSVFPFNIPTCFGLVLCSEQFIELPKIFTDLGSKIDQLHQWVEFKKLNLEANNAGLKVLFDEVIAKAYPPDLALNVFRNKFFNSWLEKLWADVPVLGNFSLGDHETKISKFIHLDEGAIKNGYARIRMKILNNEERVTSSSSSPVGSSTGLLLREIQKKTRHLPLRMLFSKIGKLILKIKPCFLMSPIAVSTYLSSPDMVFDVVIFDEASQVRPHDAICAIFRGKQLVVAGDPKQLPPTNFFSKNSSDGSDEADEDEEGTKNFESLLDVCLALGLKRKRLRWHYRSKREGLIAFSNNHFYENSLVTFPSSDENSVKAVTFNYLQDGIFADSVNLIEAKMVAQMVMNHYQDNPKLSLGVIAFSVSQQNQILDELEALRIQNPSLEDFFSTNVEDQFFVKNLENVQGDERDVIFLSVGYGKTKDGKIPMRFGPLNLEGGERRLNVAVTRAKSFMSIISSLKASDIDLSRAKSKGAFLLRSFLDYADRGPSALAPNNSSTKTSVAILPFEKEVYEELVRNGYKVHQQIGCGGFRIDLAIIDEKQNGKYILGIECDGNSYASTPTARDRDRLRRQVLEGLGWNIFRIWSTD